MNIFIKLSLAAYGISFLFLFGILNLAVGTPYENVVCWIGGIFFCLGALLAGLQNSTRLSRRFIKKQCISTEELDRLQRLIEEKKKELLERQMAEKAMQEGGAEEEKKVLGQ